MREHWRCRSFLQDVLNTWLNDFVSFALKANQILPDDLMFLAQKETASQLYSEVQTQQHALRNLAKNR
jgi:hypothetical protein